MLRQLKGFILGAVLLVGAGSIAQATPPSLRLTSARGLLAVEQDAAVSCEPVGVSSDGNDEESGTSDGVGTQDEVCDDEHAGAEDQAAEDAGSGTVGPEDAGSDEGEVGPEDDDAEDQAEEGDETAAADETELQSGDESSTHGVAVRVAAHCSLRGRAHGELVRAIAHLEDATVGDAEAACAQALANAAAGPQSEAQTDTTGTDTHGASGSNGHGASGSNGHGRPGSQGKPSPSQEHQSGGPGHSGRGKSGTEHGGSGRSHGRQKH